MRPAASRRLQPALASLPSVAPTPHRCLQSRPLFDGLLTRVISCELQYGPLSCEFVWRGTNQPVFDEVTLPQVRTASRRLRGRGHIAWPEWHVCTTLC